MLVLYVHSYAKPWQTSGWFSESMVPPFGLELCPCGKAYSRRAAWPKLGQLLPFTESCDENCSWPMLNPSCPKVVLGLHYQIIIIIIYHYMSLYIIIYHYISLYIIIYHYISLYIMIYHYRVGIFQPKDASWCIYQIYHWYSQWKLLRPIRGSKVSSCSTPSPGVPLGDPCVSAGCLRLPDVPRCPKMSQDVPRCPKMSKVLILRAQTIVTIAVGRWPVAVWVTFSCELMLAHGTHGGWTSF